MQETEKQLTKALDEMRGMFFRELKRANQFEQEIKKLKELEKDKNHGQKNNTNQYPQDRSK